jgi:DNA-directed RNA polymerase subunit N (RpoN/RPB10)
MSLNRFSCGQVVGADFTPFLLRVGNTVRAPGELKRFTSPWRHPQNMKRLPANPRAQPVAERSSSDRLGRAGYTLRMRGRGPPPLEARVMAVPPTCPAALPSELTKVAARPRTLPSFAAETDEPRKTKALTIRNPSRRLPRHPSRCGRSVVKTYEKYRRSKNHADRIRGA